MAPERFWLFGSSAVQNMHRRWFEMHLPGDGVTYRNRTDDLQGLAIAGPKSRELLARLTRDDVSNQAFKFLDIRDSDEGLVPVIIARVSFTGELGYEIYCAPQYQLRLFEAIEEAGRDLGLKLFGGRALMSMRLEKNWGVWTMDFRPDFTAAESGLDAFVAYNKPAGYIGKAAAASEKAAGPKRRLVTMTVETRDIDCAADEPIFHAGKCVGYVTSGGYAHWLKQSMALGYVPPECAADGARLEIEILGEFYPARVHARPLYDPEGRKMRS